MLDEVVSGVLVETIVAAGRRLATAAQAVRGRRYSDDLAIAQWFDTYSLTERTPPLPDLSAEAAGELAEVLSGDAVQAVLHELLAARLTDAPETDVNMIREMFGLTIDRTAAPGIAPGLFDYYDGEICTLVGQLEGAEPSLLPQIRREALSARMIAILHAIERHTSALTFRSDPDREADFLSRYLRHVAEQHGRLEPPDFERRRRVALADLYVPPVISQIIETDPGRPEREISLWQLAAEIDRSVLLGNPGGGKTTAANALMHDHAVDSSDRVPFLVTLREFAAKDPPERSVIGHIEHRLETFYQCPAPPGLIGRILLTGRALVIFDGLDELLDTSRRSEISARVERFCAEYPLTRVLVTSRLVGYDQARLDDRQFVRYRIGSFSVEQVHDYVHKWFAQEEGVRPDKVANWATAFMGESSAIPDLRTNPLMLALMCILYRGVGYLPRNKAEVYEQCANLLFHKWDARRRIHADLRAGYLLEPVLRHLAWWLFVRDQVESAVTERELIDETAMFLYGRGFESESDARDAAKEFVDFARGRMWVFSDIGTTASGASLYSFTHRTFLEYFAATNLAYSSDTPERLARTLAPRVARNDWEVTAELAVQIKDHTSNGGAQRVFTALLGDRRHRSLAARSRVLQFLARCLRSVDPPPQTVRELSRAVLDFLLVGDLDEDDRCLPLCWLMASCTGARDIVSDEINTQLAATISSADPEARLNGLRIAAMSVIGLQGPWGDQGPNLSAQDPMVSFWQKWRDENIERHAAAIANVAINNGGMKYIALWNDLIPLEQVLDSSDGLTSLMMKTRMGILGGWWWPYLLRQIHRLAVGPDDAPFDEEKFAGKEAADLAAVGRHLMRNFEPPWITDPPEMWEQYFTDFSSVQLAPTIVLSPDCYLGAVATLLITFESNRIKNMLGKQIPELGLFDELRCYVGHRWRIMPDRDLPDLSIPEIFQRMFRDWAHNKLDFIKTETGRKT